MLTTRTEQVEGITGGTWSTPQAPSARAPPPGRASVSRWRHDVDRLREFNEPIALGPHGRGRVVVRRIVVRRTVVTQLASSKDEHPFIIHDEHRHRLASCPISCITQ